jgi:hypothetical protein
MTYELRVADGVLRTRISGTLTAADLRALADELLAAEAHLSPTPPRVTDLQALERLEVGFAEVLAFVEQHRAAPPRQPVRSALVVATDVQRGLARMFQTLNDHPLVSVEIFDDPAAALAWLRDGPGAAGGAGA